MEKITKETTLSEIFKKPENKEVLKKYNLPCLSCPLADMEIDELKIGDVCQMYGIDLKSLLKELNKE